MGGGLFFIWANSVGGFSDGIRANASSTETLAADNSVALFNVSGTVVDTVAWGTGTGQFVEQSAFAVNPDANKVLARKIEDGVMIDTDNNAADFTIM